MSQSWFYKWKHGTLAPRAQRRRRLGAEARRLFELHEGKRGSPVITVDLRDAGWRVSENTVAALVRGGQRHGAQRNLRGAAERMLTERELLAPLPSLRAAIVSDHEIEQWGGCCDHVIDHPDHVIDHGQGVRVGVDLVIGKLGSCLRRGTGARWRGGRST